MSPEESIEAGIFNILTHVDTPPGVDHKGLTVGAGHYCANQGGVRVWQGDVSLTPENLVKWAHAGIDEGPIILIVVGEDDDAEHDRAKHVASTFSVVLYFATAHYRSEHETLTDDAAAATRKPGLWQVKQDILDRILDIGICQDKDAKYHAPLVYKRGHLVSADKGMALYELQLSIRLELRYALTAWSGLSDLKGVDFTLIKEPSAALDIDKFKVSENIDHP